MRGTDLGRVKYFQFESLADTPGLLCAISTRLGGQSAGEWRWLNLSFRAGDDPAAVVANRARLCQAIGSSSDHLVVGQQVHGTLVTRVSEADRGRGALTWEDGLAETDALITDRRGLLLAVLVADCAPVVFFDPLHRSIGVAHAGWRGAVGLVAQRTVRAMSEAFASRPSDLRVGIGPSIGPCCYEVGEGVTGPVRERFPYWPDLLREGPAGRPHFDLPQSVQRQLQDIGVPPTQVEMSGFCTACHTGLFYSHRAEHGRTGRFAALIGLT